MNRPPECELQIEFSRPDRVYRTDERVQGRVRVQVDRNVHCRGLNLTAAWTTRGRGNPTHRNYFQDTVFEGIWQAGQIYEYTFEFQPPPAPLSWTGRYLGIEHHLGVHANVPWSNQIRCTEPFVWSPGARVGAPRALPERDAHDLVVGRMQAGLTVLCSGICWLAGALLLVWQLWFGVLLLVAPLLVASLIYRQQLADWRLGRVRWETPATITPGETVNIPIFVDRPRRRGIRRARLCLSGVERVSGAGPESEHKRYQHQVFSADYPMQSGETAEGPAWLCRITVPDTDAWSLDLPDNQVIWQFTLVFQLTWWPDWHRYRPVWLVPGQTNRGEGTR